MQAQITLIPYDEPGKSGTKSILFEYVDEVTGESVKKEFDIQENNPYNKLDFSKSEISSSGSKRYRIEQNESVQLSNILKVNAPRLSESGLVARSHFFLNSTGSYAAVAYNLFVGNSPWDPIEGGRVSTVKVLNKNGVVIKTLEFPYDIYEIQLTSDGKYLIYSWGERLESSSDDQKSGFKIVSTNTGAIWYEREAYRVKAIASDEGYCVRLKVIEESGRFLYLFDQKSKKLYQYPEPQIALYIDHMKYLTINSDTLGVQDLTIVK
ncbi:MAG: hypothetical protein ABJ004_18005 [Cyclobacteriaceae bacterium]